MPRASEKRMRERAKTLVEAHLDGICRGAGVQGPSIDGLMEACDADDRIALKVTRHLSLETDEEMVAHLTVDAAEAAQESEKHAARANHIATDANEIATNAGKAARQSNKLAVWSLVIAALSVLLSVILRFF